MLSEEFLSRLRSSFPEFYERVDREAADEAARLRTEAGGDLERALLRARMQGAARLWWPYVRGSMPVVGDDRGAMEGFTRLVLTVYHLVGHRPAGMESAREQVTSVLRESLDHERLTRLFDRADSDGKAEAAAAGVGIMASAGALLAPFQAWRRTRRALRWMPAPMRIAVTAVILAALGSIPLVAGVSAGIKAERAARSATHVVDTVAGKGQ